MKQLILISTELALAAYITYLSAGMETEMGELKKERKASGKHYAKLEGRLDSFEERLITMGQKQVAMWLRIMERDVEHGIHVGK